jgi:anti-anti-sigma factor
LLGSIRSVRRDCIDSPPIGASAAADGAPVGAFGSETARDGAGSPADFSVVVERRDSGTAVIVLAGELDLYRAPDIERALAEAAGSSADGSEIAAEAVRHVTVDLRSVTFIDSFTLAILLAASRRQHAQGGEMLILVGPETPTTVFEVTGFDRLLAIRRVDDESARSAM